MSDEPEWFAPKQFGYGAGLPISWQGWVVMAIYLAVLAGSVLLFSHKPPALFGILVPATAAFMLITARTTKGGWRWRWPGSRD